MTKQELNLIFSRFKEAKREVPMTSLESENLKNNIAIKCLKNIYKRNDISVDEALSIELAIKALQEKKIAINLISNYEKVIRELEDEINNPMSTAELNGVNEYRVGIRYALEVLTKYMEGE